MSKTYSRRIRSVAAGPAVHGWTRRSSHRCRCSSTKRARALTFREPPRKPAERLSADRGREGADRASVPERWVVNSLELTITGHRYVWMRSSKGLGLTVPGPPADEVVAEPLPDSGPRSGRGHGCLPRGAGGRPGLHPAAASGTAMPDRRRADTHVHYEHGHRRARPGTTVRFRERRGVHPRPRLGTGHLRCAGRSRQ